MEYRKLDLRIDLNDPLTGFMFSSKGDSVELDIIDWTNRKNIFRFFTTYVFTYRMAFEYKSLPEAEPVEVIDSELIDALKRDSTASPNEELHHFVISTNEDEWCEIVAARYEFDVEEKG